MSALDTPYINVKPGLGSFKERQDATVIALQKALRTIPPQPESPPTEQPITQNKAPT
jgi:hypothetical protein